LNKKAKDFKYPMSLFYVLAGLHAMLAGVFLARAVSSTTLKRAASMASPTETSRVDDAKGKTKADEEDEEMAVVESKEQVNED
jgi:hypothetical protein